MAELFLKNESCEFFHAVSSKAKERTLSDAILAINDHAIGSEALGYTIYDTSARYRDFGIDRDFFAKNYIAILFALKHAGTFRSYTTLIKSALGERTKVSFTIPQPGVLNVEIKQEVFGVGLVNQDDEGVVITQDANSLGLSASTATDPRTFSQTRLILNILVPAGIYTTFTFT